MRFLCLDDSGKLHQNDPCSHVVFGGISVDESCWHSLVRQTNGAKSAFFPKHGNPHHWEVKSSDFLTQNSWRRAGRRQFCFEIANILRRNGCCVFGVIIDKSKLRTTPSESIHAPLAFQRLIAKFHHEVTAKNTTGTLINDWSTHQLDRHIANCVHSQVVTKQMNEIVGGVTYGDSSSLAPLQIADLIARTFRLVAEGASHLTAFDDRLRNLRWQAAAPAMDCLNYPVDSVFDLF